MSFLAVCRYYRDYSKTGLNPLLLHIIRRIMETSLPFSGSSMGISVFNGSTLKFLMVAMSVSANSRGKRVLMKRARLSPRIVFLVHETLGDIPHEMPERNI